MALYNTDSDAANTAVRAYLTKIGEFYLQRNFNTSSGKAKKDWIRIRDDIFGGQCAYCGKDTDKLEMEHLVMFNRIDYGLHHPGNIVPACKECNSRSKKNSGEYNNWEEHLSSICETKNQKNEFFDRWKTIKKHISEGEFKYPELTPEAQKSIQIIANNLYLRIQTEFNSSIKLYEELIKAF